MNNIYIYCCVSLLTTRIFFFFIYAYSHNIIFDILFDVRNTVLVSTYLYNIVRRVWTTAKMSWYYFIVRGRPSVRFGIFDVGTPIFHYNNNIYKPRGTRSLLTTRKSIGPTSFRAVLRIGFTDLGLISPRTAVGIADSSVGHETKSRSYIHIYVHVYTGAAVAATDTQ